MRVSASAPGKLVLTGEYAVLKGAPALVLAVDRRVSVVLETGPGDTLEVVSPTLGLAAQVQIRHGRVAWSDTHPPELAWVATLLERQAHTGYLAAGRIELESDRLYHAEGESYVKLGLGSSAALAVALLGALRAAAGSPAPTLAECVREYRAARGGHGSGVDVAASLAGGLARFRLEREQPLSSAAQLPAGLHWRCLYSGRPTSTSAMLATVAAWREREPRTFAQRMHELTVIATRCAQAVSDGDAAAFLSSLANYAQALARFGEAAGADIASREHRALAAIAASHGCVYKSCGAGGGDVGIAFSADPAHLQDFTAQATKAGFNTIGLDADPQGLAVRMTDPE
ncbi:hypothetical protein EPN52_10800 [bacterium]|nr:MAG: hypothetical protein EPN52_10800 [bacterium]